MEEEKVKKINEAIEGEPPMGWKLVKIGCHSVRDAKGFWWDGRYKIYLVKTERTLRELKSDGITLYPMDKLESTFLNSDPFRFIYWDEGAREVVPQFRRTVTFTYAKGKMELSRSYPLIKKGTR